MNMTFDQAIASLSIREEWGVMLDFIQEERESAISDFQNPDYVDNPSKLARLAGEISAYDAILKHFKNAPSSGQGIT
jgi:hypothetical protein